MIPPELGRLSESTLRRYAKALGLLQEERRVSRFQAERPNQVHQFDVSQSAFFRVDRLLPDGDVLLVMHPTAEYKNKPLGPDRLRGGGRMGCGGGSTRRWTITRGIGWRAVRRRPVKTRATPLTSYGGPGGRRRTPACPPAASRTP